MWKSKRKNIFKMNKWNDSFIRPFSENTFFSTEFINIWRKNFCKLDWADLWFLKAQNCHESLQSSDNREKNCRHHIHKFAFYYLFHIMMNFYIARMTFYWCHKKLFLIHAYRLSKKFCFSDCSSRHSKHEKWIFRTIFIWLY